MSKPATLARPVIRALSAADRARVDALTRDSGGFRPDEVRVALEVFDASLGIGRGADPDYELAGVEVEGRLAGWACWGPTPCTEGTFDLYWIVVDGSSQGRGVGTMLIEEMERRVAGRARLIVVETAGRDEYFGTRSFYEKRGYRVESRISDYYAVGDDLVVYVKRSGVRDSESGEEPVHRLIRTPNSRLGTR